MRTDGEIAGHVAAWWIEPGADVLYVHGVPNDGSLWTPFLERTGGIAPDLPGFGASTKRADFDYSIDGYATWLEAFVDELGLERFSLVVHDWGAVGLALAQRRPEAIERLVVINAVPLLPGYRWHFLARRWRTRVVGELSMGFGSMRPLARLANRRLRLPADILDQFTSLDHGSQRAILRLYRSAPPAELERAGGRLGALSAPALVVWGEQDIYIPPRFAAAYAERLGGEAQVVPGAGHWPWRDDATVVDRVAAFLSAN